MKSWLENFGGPKMTIGVSVSLLIGGAASVYLILQSAKLLSKVSQRKIPSKKLSNKCVHCEAKVELDKLKEFVTCKGCEELACHNQKCSDFVFGLDVWECARCKKNRVIQQRAGEWLLKQLNQMKNSNEAIHLQKENILSVEEDESLASFVSRNQRDKVRQFIEELMARMLDGPLDDVSVGQLSSDGNCLPIIGPIPSTLSHQELRKFIQGICEDIMKLPNTIDFSGVPGRLEEPVPYFDPKKYEQLLATAVLNKMTDFYQNDKNSQNNSSGIHSDVELDSNHNQLNGKAVIDLMVKREGAGQFSAPTMERLNSTTVDDETHLLDYVQNHNVPLPDLSASDSANEEGDVQSMNSSNGTDATWEDNWLFKKRKLKTENQSIAMLVPSPTEEIKALIGDKNADETSDLSENSDTEDDGPREKATYTNTLIIEAKKPEPIQEISSITFDTSASDSLKSTPSMTSFDKANPSLVTEAKNKLLVIDDELNHLSEPQPVQTINFILSGPVTTGDNPLNELSVRVDAPTNDDEEFDSMVSPTQVREHKKSIDEQFEKLLMDDNNNNAPMDVLASDVFKSVDSVKDAVEAEIKETAGEDKVDSGPIRVATTPKIVTTATPVSVQPEAKNDSSDLEDWVMVPDENEVKVMNSILDKSISIETSTSLLTHPASSSLHKSDTLDSQPEIELDEEPVKADASPTRRYSSPLFQNLLKTPVEAVKLSKPSIPEDNSIHNLLHAANLVSKTQKTPETLIKVENGDNEILTPTNTPESSLSEEAIDENLFNKLSVPEERPSVQDPEKVLMENVIPGSFAEREHIKWLHAAPIANNPYSSEALQRRLSESDNKSKGFDMTNNNKLVDALVEESTMSEDKEENEEAFQPKKIDMKRYKRDYYVNDSSDGNKRHSYGSSTSKSPSVEDEQSEIIVPVRSAEKGFLSNLLHSGDNDLTGGSISSDQDGAGIYLTSPKSTKSNDDSLTYSEDSDTTRIYNIDTRVAKIVAPVEDSNSGGSPIESPVKLAQQFFRGSPKHQGIRKMDDEVTTVIRTSNRNVINGGDDSEHIVQEIYEEKQVIEPEVIDSLPSVKKLAEIYGKDNSPPEIQLNKPKAFIATTEEAFTPVVHHQKVAKAASSESFAPIYNHSYHPADPIASITARSIPSQIRADLKKSYSYDDESIVRHGEREGSPDIPSEITRNSIAFFENLKK